jgi:hypothetical protein
MYKTAANVKNEKNPRNYLRGFFNAYALTIKN